MPATGKSKVASTSEDCHQDSDIDTSGEFAHDKNTPAPLQPPSSPSSSQKDSDTGKGTPSARKRKKMKLCGEDKNENGLSPMLLSSPTKDLVLKNDPFHDIKRVIMDASYRFTVANSSLYFNRLSNIFIKNWRFSNQFKHVLNNQRSRKSIIELIRRIAENLYEKGLIVVKGPEDDTMIVEMIATEISEGNKKLFSRTPPTLTILVTSTLFDKYFSGYDKHEYMLVKDMASKAEKRNIVLKDDGKEWLKLQKELGISDNDKIAEFLIHCYKSWNSIACGKCRRHMDVSMDQKMGRRTFNKTAVCVVSCVCGETTSGGFMIECDTCHKWQHGVCVDISQESIPQVYSCHKCEQKERYRRSRRLEDTMSDASVTSMGNEELVSTDDSEPEVITID